MRSRLVALTILAGVVAPLPGAGPRPLAAESASVAVVHTADTAVALGGYVGMTPTRLLDTRIGLGAPTGPVPPDGAIELQVTGVDSIPAEATGVMFNLTGTAPTAETFITTWPAGLDRPTASNLNLRSGETRANAVAIGLGEGGRLSLYNYAGSTHLVVDVTGYMLPDGHAAAGFVALPPDRLLDTRSGLGATAGSIDGGETITLQVGGRSGVPTGARAAVLNVTATEATALGHITVWPDGAERPVASSLNFRAGQTVPNLVVATLSPEGRASFFHYGGEVHLIADVLGYFSDSVVAAAGRFIPIGPTRVEDTRINRSGVSPEFGVVHHDSTISVSLSNPAFNPIGTVELPVDVGAVVVNVTAVGATAPGFVTAHPEGVLPPTSTLNVAPGDVVANLAVVPITDPEEPYIELYNYGGDLDLVVDVVGYIGDHALLSGGTEADLWWLGAAAVAGDGSLVVGAIDGDLPVVVRCESRRCTQRSVVAVDEVPVDGRGWGMSIRVGADGLPRMLVHKGTPTGGSGPTSRAYFVRCLDVSCESRTVSAHDGNAIMALDSSGRGVLLRRIRDWTGTDYPVRLDHCADDACTSFDGGSELPTTDLQRSFASAIIEMDPTGVPVIAYAPQTKQGAVTFDNALAVVRCADVVCSSYTEAPLGERSEYQSSDLQAEGSVVSLQFGAGARPVILWNAPILVRFLGAVFPVGSQAMVTRCDDVACSASAQTPVATSGFAFNALSAALAPSGTRVLAGIEVIELEGNSPPKRARLVSCLDTTCSTTASAAISKEVVTDGLVLMTDPAGGFYTVRETYEGLEFQHLGLD